MFNIFFTTSSDANDRFCKALSSPDLQNLSESNESRNPPIPGKIRFFHNACQAALFGGSFALSMIALSLPLTSAAAEGPFCNSSLSRISLPTTSLTQDIVLVTTTSISTLALLGAAVRNFTDMQERQIASLIPVQNEIFKEITESSHPFEKFFEDYQDEIEQLQDGMKVGQWKELGSGVSKTTFVHPELTRYVIKIQKQSAVHWKYNDNNLRAHHRNLGNAKKIIEEGGYKHIVIPESYLIETKRGLIIVERRLDLVKGSAIPETSLKEAAINELVKFIVENGVCDLDHKANHNAEFLKNSEEDPKIGIYDLDCEMSILERMTTKVRAGLDFEAGIAVAKTYIEKENFSSRFDALQLFKALFEKGQGFEAGIVSATAIIEKGKPFIDVGLELFEELFDRNQGFKAGIASATANIKKGDPYNLAAIRLFKALFKKNQGFEEAIAVVKENIEKEDLSTQIDALVILEALPDAIGKNLLEAIPYAIREKLEI